MKKLLALAAVLALPFVSSAQLSTNSTTRPSSPLDFFNQAVSWATTFNTNYDGVFTNNHALLWASVVSIQGSGANLANEIGLAYEPLTSHTISIEAVTRNGGVAGTLMSQGAGAAFNFNVHDLRISAYAEGVYQFVDRFDSNGIKEDKFGGEIGVRAYKAIGLNTYMVIGIGAQFPANHQIFSAGVGIRL